MIHSQIEIDGKELVCVDREKFLWLLNVADDQLKSDFGNLMGQEIEQERTIKEFRKYRAEIKEDIDHLEDDTIPYLQNLIAIRQGTSF